MKLNYFLTVGNSLGDWQRNGTINRELRILNELHEHFSAIDCISFGGLFDMRFAKRKSNIKFKFKNFYLNNDKYIRKILQNIQENKGLQIIRTNQFYGADIIIKNLKSLKINNSIFVLRMGYLPSDNLFHETYYDEYKKVYNLEKESCAWAKLIVVSTERIKIELKERGINSKKIVVIPNYVDCDLFAPGKAEQNNFTIGYIGRLAQEKNLVKLLLSLKGINCDVIFIGTGPMRKELVSLANEHKINLKIISRVPNEMLPRYISLFDVFVLNSEYEGNPKSLLEAMACGKIVIGNNVQGINEIITNEKNGILVKNSNELRESIVQIINNKTSFEYLGHNARKSIKDNFGLNKIVKLEFELIEKIRMMN